MVKTLIDLHLGHFFSCLIKPANLVMVAKWQVHLAQRQMNSPIIQMRALNNYETLSSRA